MNALVTALPGLVIIFVLAGGVNALAGVLLSVGKKFAIFTLRVKAREASLLAKYMVYSAVFG